jgi:hypothetical protein
MANVLRFLIIVSAVLVAASITMEFQRPLDVDLPIKGPPPIWILGYFSVLFAVATGIPASVGLLRLRKWGRILGAWAAAMALLGIITTAHSPISAAAGPVIRAMFVAGVLTWSLGVVLAFLPSFSALDRNPHAKDA